MEKFTPVVVYLNGEAVGEGNLLYVDVSLAGTQPRTEYHCDPSDLIINGSVVERGIALCWYDTVTSYASGVERRLLRVPVLLDSDVVGEAEIEVEDSYTGIYVEVPRVEVALPLGVFYMLREIVRGLPGIIEYLEEEVEEEEEEE